VEQLMTSVTPLLVEAMAELLKVVETVDAKEERYREIARENPAFNPPRPFNPVDWLASYLIKHNPNQGGELSGETKACKYMFVCSLLRLCLGSMCESTPVRATRAGLVCPVVCNLLKLTNVHLRVMQSTDASVIDSVLGGDAAATE
jgi:hypothetical protein